jgi:pSer/pThr/pTyr-binding forkhead associated (FHA) protein
MNEQNNNPKEFPQGVYLVINSQIVPIKKLTTSIGRKLDNDLVIQDNLVSRYHAEIKHKDGNFIINDLDSTSGTYLNNKRVDQSLLYSGDLILVANIPIMFIDESGTLERAAEKETSNK